MSTRAPLPQSSPHASLTPSSSHVARAGYWASVIGAILALLWVILAVGFGAAPWSGIEEYASTFHRSQVLNTAPALLLAPTMIVLFAALHYSSHQQWKLNTIVALAFAAVYTGIITSIYALQLHTVSLNILSRELAGLSLLALPNFHSAFFALDTLGYAFLSLAGLAVIPLFPGSGRPSWIRRLLALDGALGVLGLFLLPLDLPWVIIAGGGLWGLTFPVAMILVSRQFSGPLLGRAKDA